MEKRETIKLEKEAIKLEKEKIYYSLYLISKKYVYNKNKIIGEKQDTSDIFEAFTFDFERLELADTVSEFNKLKTKLETSLNKLIELHDSDKVYLIYSILNNIINFVYGTGQ